MSKYCYKCEKDVDLVTDADSNAQLCSICGTVIIRSASHLPAGTILGGFEIVDELGRGGMGIVYRARQMNLERDVALKVLADDLASDHEFVTRFFKEARAAASLNHPNIVQAFDAGSSPEGISYFAMELIEGETLESHIENQGKLSPKQSLKVAVQIAGALDYAWKSQKLTHGDIKPDNIILNKTGGAKLADLGLAKFVHDDNSDDGIMATPLYAPPEVIKGDVQAIGFHSDMYSFGATVYQMLAGVPPFPDNTPEIVFKQHLEEKPSPLTNYNDKLAPALVQLVEQMLAKKVANRPETWEDVHLGLKKIRTPEVTGKVFHAHANSHEEAETAPHPPPPSIAPALIKGIIAFVLVILIAVVAVVVISKTGDGGGNGKGNQIEDPQLVLDQWESIKQSISKMKTEDALAKVRQFIEKNKDVVPDDTLRALNVLEKRAIAEKRLGDKRAKEIAAFNSLVGVLVKDLKGVDVNSKELTIPKLTVLNNRIEDIYEKRVAGKGAFVVCEEDSDVLNNAYHKISTRIIKHQQEMERLRQEKIAKQQQEQLKKEKLRIAEEAKERADQLSLSKTIDNYYMALGLFKESKKLSTLKENIQDWDKGSSLVSSDYTIRVDFINKNVIPRAPEIYKLLQAKEEYFKGEALPEEMCPEKLKNYKIKEISKSGIKLYFNSEKVTLGHSLQWSSIPYKHIALLIKENLLSNEEDLLEDDEKIIVLSFTLLFEPESYLVMYNNMQYDLPQSGKIWKLLKGDFDIAEKELSCIKVYKSLITSLNQQDYSQSGNILQSLLSISKNTDFRKRYSKELLGIERDLKKYSPAIMAAKYTDKCLSLSSDNPSEVYNTAMVVYSRYNNCMDKLDKDNREELSIRKNRSISSLMGKSGVKSLSDNRIPFYYWAKEKEGSSKAYLEIADRSRRLSSMSRVMKSLKLAVNVDNGNWTEVKENFGTMPVSYFYTIRDARSVKSWIASLLFGYALADMQFGDGTARSKIREFMQQVYDNNVSSPMSPLVTSLAFEYSLLSRNRSFPLSVSKQFDYTTGGTMSLRVGMLGMLANLESAKPKHFTFRSLKEHLNKIFAKDSSLRGDLFFISQAGVLFSNKPISIGNINQLVSAQCVYPDISARLLLSALSRYHCKNDTQFNDEDRLIKSLEKHVTPMTVSGDLWRKLVLYKMSAAPYAGDIKRIAETAMDDTRSCTSRFYPGLLMFQAGAEYALGNFNKKEAEAYLKSYFRASSLVNRDDIDNLEIVTSSTPQLIVQRLFQEQQPEKAFRYGILGIMMHCKDPVKKSALVQVMNSNTNSLCWEERFFLRQVQNWR